MSKIERTVNNIRMEITKREFQIQDKNTEIANLRNGIIERIEQLKINLKINLELLASRALIQMEKKVEDDMDSLKTRIFSLEATLKGFQKPPPAENTLAQKLGKGLVQKVEDHNRYCINELNRARNQISDLIKENQMANFKCTKAEFEYEHLKQEYKRLGMEFE